MCVLVCAQGINLHVHDGEAVDIDRESVLVLSEHLRRHVSDGATQHARHFSRHVPRTSWDIQTNHKNSI